MVIFYFFKFGVTVRKGRESDKNCEKEQKFSSWERINGLGIALVSWSHFVASCIMFYCLSCGAFECQNFFIVVTFFFTFILGFQKVKEKTENLELCVTILCMTYAILNISFFHTLFFFNFNIMKNSRKAIKFCHNFSPTGKRAVNYYVNLFRMTSQVAKDCQLIDQQKKKDLKTMARWVLYLPI